MVKTEDTIVVFTARSPERIVREGGSQAWVLNPVHARQCRWLICTQNRNNPDLEFSDATEPHGAGFLLGRIASITRATDPAAGDRWMIAIGEFARIERPDLWDHRRNPVRYTNLKELGFRPEEIEFQPMPKPKKRVETRAVASAAALLTIAEAKKELAATFGVRPEAVEITIRG